jgi:hypothetical protein
MDVPWRPENRNYLTEAELLKLIERLRADNHNPQENGDDDDANR